MKRSSGALKTIAKNKKAMFLYHILDRFEAGIELTGTEIKSIRAGKFDISDAFCKISKGDELHIQKMNISPYEQGGYVNHEPLRKRKLLMRKREIRRLRSKLQERGYTLVPVRMYFKRAWLKIELGLARGKAKHDKREDLKKKEARREIRHYRH